MASNRPMEPFSCVKVSSLLLLSLLLLSWVGGWPEASFLFLLLCPIPVTLVPPDWPTVSFGGDCMDVELCGELVVVAMLVVVVVASVDSWSSVKLTIDLPGIGCLEMYS